MRVTATERILAYMVDALPWLLLAAFIIAGIGVAGICIEIRKKGMK